MEFFTFEESDYQVMEMIEFDETIQRPEKIRFFTLTEQTTDAYEKLMPRGRVTRFQREEVRKEVERVQELYGQYVVALPDEYKLREPSYGKHFDWVHPVYAKNESRSYDWVTQYYPLFTNVRLPGFYPRLLEAMPRPFADIPGIPYDLTEPTRMVNTNGQGDARALPRYEMTRTQRHEDKTLSVVKVPVDGTQDMVSFVGYYLEKRVLDVPNPFAGHPFLESNTPRYVESTASLRDVVPSLDAILTHGVPVTKDPYGIGMDYLKVYDVNLRDIPWNAWKSKFPPVDIINEAPIGEPIAYPKPSQFAPPDNVIEAYKSAYYPGTSVRLWLMNQLDGGGMIQTLLLSQAIDNGSVQSIPGIDLEQASYPPSTIEECSLAGKSFQDFLITGNLRRTPSGVFQCVPLEFIKQERGRAGYINRIPWGETTGDDIKKEYIRRLEEIRPVEEGKQKTEVLSKTPQRQDSIRRAEVLAILDDTHRFADDKSKDIQIILTETTLSNNIYRDTNELFVMCSHTNALLNGDLATDRLKFYETWTARVDGFRVCTFCGERINADVLVDQIQFDEDGRLIRNTEAFEQSTFHSAGVRSFASGLLSLRPLFMEGNAHDDAVLLLLTVLQVLPTAETLNTCLTFGRAVAKAQFSTGASDANAKLIGSTGIATTALLLQAHIPTLVPRRSFGTKPLILSGYPRDSNEPAEYSIVDSLLLVIRKTFESFPTSFKGPAQQVIRAVLNKPAEIKKFVTTLLSAKSPLIKGLKDLPSPIPGLLAIARGHYVDNPPRVEVIKTLVPVFAVPKELGVVNSFVLCPSSRPVLANGVYPKTMQSPMVLGNGIHVPRNAKNAPPSISQRVQPIVTENDTIRSRLTKVAKNQTGIPIRDSPVANLMIASRISDMFFQGEPVRTVELTRDASIVRDISRGILAETLALVQGDPKKRRTLEEQRTKDLALYTLSSEYTKARAEVNSLVANERMTFVKRMSEKSDTEREIMQELLGIGLAPYVISRSDREEFAREAERLREEIFRVDAIDIGVGQPSDVFEQGEEGPRGVDNGDYGDYLGMPGNDGRDHDQPQITDDDQPPI